MAIFVFFAPNSRAQNLNSPTTNTIKLDEESFLSRSKFQGDWKLEIGAQSFEEDTDDEKLATVALSVRPSYRLLENLTLKADMKFKSESGRVQARFYQEGENLMSLSNASLEYYPTSFIMIEGGILNQGFLEQELLFSKSRAFAGVKEALVLNKQNYKIYLTAQQSLPSSSSLNTERAEKEETPSFTSQTLQAEFNTDSLKGIVGGSYFQFDNLPSKVAYESIVNGNSVIEQGIANSYFEYNFKGYAFQTRLDWRLQDSLNIVGTLQLIENSEAPAGNSRGQMAWLGPIIQTGQLKWTFNYGQFFAEPDVAPAYYMNLNYGGANRIGKFGRFELEFSDYNFKIIAQYADSDVINLRTHQFQRINYLVRLETLYVSF
ncbi:MAG: hypothetical protein KDD58_05280 [Bdellovibrionales bacterium]|nr:hypothetical protein [Bdellovibrionales bacterium]